jgi:hypothetical protein
MSQISTGGSGGLPILAPANGNGSLGTSSGWAISEQSGTGTPRTLLVSSAVRFSGDTSLSISAGNISAAFGAFAQKVYPGQILKVTVRYLSDTIWPSGLYLRLQERSTKPEKNVITFTAGGIGALPANPASDRTSLTDILSNASISVANQWFAAEFIYTVPAGVYWVCPAVYAWNATGAPATANLWFDWSLDLAYGDYLPNDYSRLISRTTGISALTAGTLTPLFTVPTNRSLTVTDIIIKTNTVTGTVTTTPSISIGSNAATYDNLMTTQVMTGAITTNRAFKAPMFGAMPVFQAGNIIQAQIDAAQVGATALTYDIELYGVLS